ncbi:MAG: type III-A CRISPR-associated protein Cas10/Csm1 [Deltaproteobacteria bacterium]|nr:type III-A CRISPR-associated protein Cas10/Csm1 [Deltaproteobacteria bacterium]
MMNAMEKLAVAGLLHDVGKFMQRAHPSADVLDPLVRNLEGTICRVSRDSPSGYSHRHALWTMGFFQEYYERRFPQFSGERTEDCIANLAARHHRADSPLQWIVSEADQLSAGDCSRQDYQPDVEGGMAYKKTRLIPVTDRIRLKDKPRTEILHRLEVFEHNPNADEFFPAQKETLKPPIDESLEQARYAPLWKNFVDGFHRLPTSSIDVFITGLFYLLERYTVQIPTSTVDFPDITLFDHARTTAAIACCLWDHHQHCGDMNIGAIKDRSAEKFLLVCGDISGIQKFIYNITSKGAARGLRGRSFYLQVLCETAAKFILRSLGYHLANLLFSGGGRFYLLVAPHHRESLHELQKTINDFLLNRYAGELYLGLGHSIFPGKDFRLGGDGQPFSRHWETASMHSGEEKKRRFLGFDYEKLFSIEQVTGFHLTCGICRSTREVSQGEDINVCDDCRKMEELGKSLSRAVALAEGWDGAIPSGKDRLDFSALGCRYALLRDSDNRMELFRRGAKVYKLNSVDFLEPGERFSPFCGYRFVAGNRTPEDPDGVPLDFDKIAARSTGVRRLAILRMDVDNLGRLFREGFIESDEATGNELDEASISRVAGFSRALDDFFNGRVHYIANKNEYRDRVAVLYSGGDDLFVVGAWDGVVEMAGAIQEDFRRFACGNPSLTLSAGITIVSPKYPIAFAAEAAGEEEHRSKSDRDFIRSGSPSMLCTARKDAVTFFSRTLGWDEFALARQLAYDMRGWLEEGVFNRSLLHRLGQIHALYHDNRKCWMERKDTMDIAQLGERIRYSKWLWRMVYGLRRLGSQEKGKVEAERLAEALIHNRFNGHASARMVIDYLDVPVRWAEFMVRKED